MMDFLIFILGVIFYFPLSVVNFLMVGKLYYFKDTGITLSKLANRDLRTLLNKTLRGEGGYDFGKDGETISSALGKNQCLGTLSKRGEVVVRLLHKCETYHCLKSVHDECFEEQKKALMNKN